MKVFGGSEQVPAVAGNWAQEHSVGAHHDVKCSSESKSHLQGSDPSPAIPVWMPMSQLRHIRQHHLHPTTSHLGKQGLTPKITTS